MASAELARVLEKIDRLNVNWFCERRSRSDGSPDVINTIKFYEQSKEGVIEGGIYCNHSSVSVSVSMNDKCILNKWVFRPDEWYEFGRMGDFRYIRNYFKRIAEPLYQREVARWKAEEQERRQRDRQIKDNFFGISEKPEKKEMVVDPGLLRAYVDIQRVMAKYDCPACCGSGDVDCDACGGNGKHQDGHLCHRCNGNRKTRCGLCHGTGKNPNLQE